MRTHSVHWGSMVK